MSADLIYYIPTSVRIIKTYEQKFLLIFIFILIPILVISIDYNLKF